MSIPPSRTLTKDLMATPPNSNNPLSSGGAAKKTGKSGPAGFKSDNNRGPAQKIDRNRNISGAPKTGRTPKR